MIPAQRFPDGGEPVTEPFVLDLVARIPMQRSAPPDVVVEAPVRRPDPVLVQQMAARPARPPVLDRLTAVVVGALLVAVLLLVLLLS